MIGRGTRLCSGLYGNDDNGNPLDKQKFRIFDHWGNFEYHELHTEEGPKKSGDKIAGAKTLRGLGDAGAARAA